MNKIFNELAIKYIAYVSVLLDFNRKELLELYNMNKEDAIETLSRLSNEKRKKEEEKDLALLELSNPNFCIGYNDF